MAKDIENLKPSEFKTSCFCSKGYVKENNSPKAKCIKENECPKPTCKQNSSWQEDRMYDVPYCSTRAKLEATKTLHATYGFMYGQPYVKPEPGCYCNDGFVKSDFGKHECIPESECPSCNDRNAAISRPGTFDIYCNKNTHAVLPNDPSKPPKSQYYVCNCKFGYVRGYDDRDAPCFNIKLCIEGAIPPKDVIQAQMQQFSQQQAQAQNLPQQFPQPAAILSEPQTVSFSGYSNQAAAKSNPEPSYTENTYSYSGYNSKKDTRSSGNSLLPQNYDPNSNNNRNVGKNNFFSNNFYG